MDFDDFSNDVSSEAYSSYAPMLEDRNQATEPEQATSGPSSAPVMRFQGGSKDYMDQVYSRLLGHTRGTRLAKAGKSMYDTVEDPANSPSSWDYIVKGE